MNPASIGRLGEDAAAAYLQKQGYTLVERNYHTRQGEIDIIAYDGGCLCFVEVKTRKNADFGLASEAVNFHKREKLIGAARHYLAYHTIDADIRFDIVEVYGRVRQSGFVAEKIRVMKNAFDATGMEE